MDATNTLHNLLTELDLQDSPDYVSADSQKVRPQDRHFLDWGREKIHAEGVVFQRIPVNDSSYPLAYFRRLEDDSPANIAQAHRLAWNMGRAPLLFIVASGRVLVYSTYDRPRPRQTDGSLDDKAGLMDTIDLITKVEEARQIFKKYKREELLSGRFWESEETRKRFNPRTRVEKSLLDNLSAIRFLLVDREKRDPQIVHSLLGRAIFIQYLQDRKDAQGYSAFPQDYLERFLSGAKSFPDILSNQHATYALFEALEDKFNGDIFPVTAAERDSIHSSHLALLAQFLRGKMDVRSKQLSFWPYYSFDAIPIEFISNMYEEFFHYETEEKETEQREVADGRRSKESGGTYYTPQRLVEFVLDEVLPWEGTNSEVRILDPACGSGIFLVEAYRRLISRWRQANPAARPDAAVLKRLLTDNLHGVDSNPEAIRVAAFSLCLTMCDYFEPRYLWTSVKFPPLRDTNLWSQDFFSFADSVPKNVGSFDLVSGNPPWESQLSDCARAFLQKRGLTVGDKQIAQAFLWAAPQLCKKGGRVCLIAPSKGLLFNTSGPNRDFRRQFLQRFKVNTIVNLAPLRRTLFAKAVGPAAPVIFEPTAPAEGHTILYCCPKPSNSPEDGWHYVIENHDMCRIPWQEAAQNEHIWKTAMWGGPRDWDLVRRLMELPSLLRVATRRKWAHGEGFIVGRKNRKRADWLTGKPFVSHDVLHAFTIDEHSLPNLTETQFTEPRSRNRRIFQSPHVLIRQSPKAGTGFIASLIERDTVFNHSLLGISSPRQDIGRLGAACVAFATNVCTYFAIMTSSRWLVERDEMDKGEIMRFPLPASIERGALQISPSQLRDATRNGQSFRRLVAAVSEAYGLSATDQALICDAVKYTLDYFRLGANSMAAKPAGETVLRRYALMFSRILQESFGKGGEGGFPACIYMGDNPLAVLEVSLAGKTSQRGIEIRRADGDLSKALKAMDLTLLEKRSPGVYVRRDVHVYRDDKVFIAKRNLERLWTQAAAMRDADEVYAEIMRAYGEEAWE